jgi:hypothetical protein
MQDFRNPQARTVACDDDARVLSVPEVVDYIDGHWYDPKWSLEHGFGPHLISARSARRYLSSGHWPCTRTAAGHLGITVRDLRAIFTSKPPAGASS